MRPVETLRLSTLGICVDDGIPPTIETEGCGPRLGVEIVLRFASPDGAHEVTIGSCGDKCDLIVIVEVAVCESTRTIGTNDHTFTEIRGGVTIIDNAIGRMFSLNGEHTILVEIGLLPDCVDRDETRA